MSMPVSFDTLAVTVLAFVALRGVILLIRADLIHPEEIEEGEG